MKKYVFFDTNCCNDDGSYHIHELLVKRQKLTAGDHVTAYMDYEEWDAQIVRCGDQWGVELLSETRELSAERYEGQQKGYNHGRLIEQLRTLRVLNDMGLSNDIVEEVKRRMLLI